MSRRSGFGGWRSQLTLIKSSVGFTPSFNLLSSAWMSFGASSAMAFARSLCRPRISCTDRPGMAGGRADGGG